MYPFCIYSPDLRVSSDTCKLARNYCFTMEYPSLLLLLVLAASVFSVRSQCPSEEDILPCKCKADSITDDMTVVCTGRSTTLNELKSSLSHFSKKEEIFSIQLIFLNLGTIPSNFFEGITVKKMTISNCEIDFEYGKLPLKGLEDSLQALTIRSSLTQKNAPLYIKLGHLKELETLELSNNKITELRNDIFDDEMPNLYSLHLDHNIIEKIGDSTFKSLTNVKYFELSGNKLGILRRDMIPTSATQLFDLHLENNILTDLEDNLFIAMPSLETVYLQNNKFKILDRYKWKNILEQLDTIYLTGNPIQCDSGMDWIINSTISAYKLIGKCAGPAKEKGLDLWRFIDNVREKRV